MATKREDKYALAKLRRERGVSAAQEKQLAGWKQADERMAFNEKMGTNVASASPLTANQQGRFYEATGIENASNPEEAIKGEILNTGLSFVQIANALGNKVGADDAVARGAGQVLGRMIPYGTGTMDTNKAVDTYTKWGTGNVTKQDVANAALTSVGTKAIGTGVKSLLPLARGVRASGIPLPVPGISVGGIGGTIRIGGNKPIVGAARSSLIPAENTATGSVTEGVQRKVKAVYDEVMSFPKNIPGHEDLAGKSFEDVIDLANKTQDTELIDLTNSLYREQNAMAPLTVLDAAQSAATGEPATLGKALTQKNLGWMAKHIDPTDISTHTLSYFTKTKDQLKQHMFGTLKGGAKRAGLDPSVFEFERWQDIPDGALEKALSNWDGNFHGVVDSSGNKVPSLGLAWDHIDSLYNGGENTSRNLQAMVQYINASLGAKTK